MGKPLHIRTDNGPGYTSTAFKAFCSSYKILHTTGVPYNPQGQAVVERDQQTLNVQLQRQEGGDSSQPLKLTKLLLV
jgi:transposase InsO family protein